MDKPRLPKLPGIGENPISAASRFIKGGIDDIQKLAKDINDGVAVLDHTVARAADIVDEQVKAVVEPSEPDFVTDDDTYKFQLGLLIDNATDLETVHLPNKGRIGGKPCDCIAKHARVLGAHAKETIPIATRQGKDGYFFANIVEIADRLMAIGTREAVESGQYDGEYLQQAGAMSRYRKKLEELLGRAHKPYSEECKDCPSTLNLKTFIEKQKQAAAVKPAEPIKSASEHSETETG